MQKEQIKMPRELVTHGDISSGFYYGERRSKSYAVKVYPQMASQISIRFEG